MFPHACLDSCSLHRSVVLIKDFFVLLLFSQPCYLCCCFHCSDMSTHFLIRWQSQYEALSLDSRKEAVILLIKQKALESRVVDTGGGVCLKCVPLWSRYVPVLWLTWRSTGDRWQFHDPVKTHGIIVWVEYRWWWREQSVFGSGGTDNVIILNSNLLKIAMVTLHLVAAKILLFRHQWNMAKTVLSTLV